MAETLIALHCITNFLTVVNPRVTDVLLWPEVHMKLMKAVPFIARDIDMSKVTKPVLEHFSGVHNQSRVLV